MSATAAKHGGAEPPPAAGLAALVDRVERGDVHTVRVCFSDHYGQLRGRRLAAGEFLATIDSRQGFCDGALVWDVKCEIFEATEFSNYRTGYPDCYAVPDLSTLAPSAAVDGEWGVLCDVVDAAGAASPLDARNVLRRVALQVPGDVRVGARLQLRLAADEPALWAPGAASPLAERLLAGLRRTGLAVKALQSSRPSRTIVVVFDTRPPLELADSLIMARTAAREIADSAGLDLTAMPRDGSPLPPLALELDLGGTRRDPGERDRLADLTLLEAPLPLGYPRDAGAAGSGATRASSDANPYLALAAALIARFANAPGSESEKEISFEQAIGAFAAADWTEGWLDPLFRRDALALARHEATVRAAAVTEWDHARYRGVG